MGENNGWNGSIQLIQPILSLNKMLFEKKEKENGHIWYNYKTYLLSL